MDSTEKEAAAKLTAAHDFFYVNAEEKLKARAEAGIKIGKKVEGYDFNQGIDWEKLTDAYASMGFQGSSLGQAIEEINRMINWRLSDEPIGPEEDEDLRDPEVRANTKCTIFLGYTSNMISCGSRELIRFLCQHKMVDCIVTTGGGIEEDFIKCFADTYVGDFAYKGSDLRRQGLNRIGNLLIANENYVNFEDWCMPILDKMVEEQKSQGTVWSPSKIINRLGQEINDERSVYYWCWKNNIPVFCPAITDGSLGDMIYFQSYSNPGLIVDIAQDIRRINNIAVVAKKSGMIILGGGVIKHHICNANLLRNGADFSVFINTGQEFDGSDTGARPDEAVSWGKIKMQNTAVKIYCEVSLVLPIIIAKTFARQYFEARQKQT